MTDTPEVNKLKPTGDLARWEARHPFNRLDHVDPLLAFRMRERRNAGGGEEAKEWFHES